MIDLHHPLAVLANQLPWSQIEAAPADSVDGFLAVPETRIQPQ